MPIRPVTEKLTAEGERPTHIVIVTNRARDKKAKGGIGRKVAEWPMLRGFSDKLRDAYKNSEIKFQENLQYLRESGIPYVVIWTDGTMKTLDTDPEKIKKATLTTYLRSMNTLDRYLPKKIFPETQRRFFVSPYEIYCSFQEKYAAFYKPCRRSYLYGRSHRPHNDAAQLIEIYLHHSARDVSLFSWTSYLLGTIGYLIYGILHKQKPIIFLNAVNLPIYALIVVGILLYN